MSGWLALLPSAEGRTRGFPAACAWFEEALGMQRDGGVDGAAPVRCFRGRVRGGARLAVRDASWCVAAGELWTAGGEAEPVELDDLLARLLREGRAALDAVDGSFALAWFDAATGRLETASDHLGRRHVFVAETGEGLCAGTSAIAVARWAGAEPDPAGVTEFLACGTNYEDRTLFRAVRRVDVAPTRVVFPDAPEADAAAVERATRAACAAGVDGEPGTILPDLTGGLDSRLLVAFLLGSERVRDVTVTGSPSDADVRIATRLAERIGLAMHRVDAAVPEEARSSLSTVLEAASLADGGYDAIEYAGIARIHGDHAGRWVESRNGSGGEMFRNYWWSARDLDRSIDPVARAFPRFVAGTQLPAWFASPDPFEPAAHFRDVLTRTAAPHRGAPAWRVLDLFYLQLRMQCWQGSIASATNRIWPALSPFLDRAPLEAVFRCPPRIRLGTRLFRSMLRSAPPAFRHERLADGYPPVAPGPANAWRFVPGLAAAPVRFGARVYRRLRPSASATLAGSRIVQRLTDDGLRDWLGWNELRLQPFLEKRSWSRFLESPAAPVSQVGRLLSVENALRSAAVSDPA